MEATLSIPHSEGLPAHENHMERLHGARSLPFTQAADTTAELVKPNSPPVVLPKNAPRWTEPPGGGSSAWREEFPKRATVGLRVCCTFLKSLGR